MICPDPEVLDRFLRRRLSQADSRVLSTHVDSCAVCRSRLEELSNEQRVLDELQLLVPDPAPASGRVARRAEAPGLPAEIAGYRVLERIGMGGMGVVYRAEQEHPRREVALKVIHPSQVTPTALRRLELEAAALGRLEHPGIAKVFASGTAEERGAGEGGVSQPYIAMEYVRGERLIAHCTGHELDLRARLELVREVCAAMEHAHARGIVHRDLKPGNVLVDAEGRAKVIDFGLARATDGDLGQSTAHTRSGQVLGTLPYMAPEQVGADPDAIDARTDVYGLGAILYELLTGRPPFDFRGTPLPQAALAIAHEEVARPSSIAAELPKGLDWIVLRALAKEPARRYASASALGEDLRRLCADEPLAAGPPAPLYKLTLFARRHRAGLVALGAVVLVGALGLGGFLRKSDELEAAARRFEADVDAIVARTERCFRMRSRPGEVRARDLGLGPAGDRAGQPSGATAAAARVEGETLAFFGLVEEAVERFESALSKERATQGASSRPVLETQLRLARLCAGLQDGAHAEELARQGLGAALEAGRASAFAATTDGGRADLVRGFRIALARGLLAQVEGGAPHAEQLLTEARQALEQVLAAEPEGGLEPGDRSELARALRSARIALGEALAAGGEAEAGEVLLRSVLEAPPPGDARRAPSGRFDRGARLGLARLLERTGRLEEAEGLVVEVLAEVEDELGANNPQVLGLRNALGAVRMGQFRFADAEAEFRAVLAGWQLFFEDEALARDDARVAWDNLGASLLMQGKLDEAEPILRASLERQRGDARGLALVEQNLGVLALKRTEWETARSHFRSAFELNTEVFGADDPRTLGSKHDLARALWRLERWDAAAALFGELSRALAAGASMMSIERPWMVSYVLADCLRNGGDPASALDVLWPAFEAESQSEARPEVRVTYLVGIVDALSSLQDYGEARGVLVEGLRIATGGGVSTGLMHWLEVELADVDGRLGDTAAARARLEAVWPQLSVEERADYADTRERVLGS